jgi:hypothetical protein
MVYKRACERGGSEVAEVFRLNVRSTQSVVGQIREEEQLLRTMSGMLFERAKRRLNTGLVSKMTPVYQSAFVAIVNFRYRICPAY